MLLRSIQALLLCFVLYPLAGLAGEVNKPKISFVVDDLGDNSIIAKQIINLPATLTLAFLPHTPHAKKLSSIAANQGHEVIMHLPMEAFTRPDLLGPGAIFSNMTQVQLIQTFLASAESIPNLIGFNNHMGSLLTQSDEKMTWLMEMAKQKDWYFLDSKTSEDSVAQTIAKQTGLATIGRDIFLDHYTDANPLNEVLSQQLQRAKKIALRQGQVVIICHPYPETLAFLKAQLPKLKQDFELVKISNLLLPTIKKLAKR